jgi:hypothetical protein
VKRTDKRKPASVGPSTALESLPGSAFRAIEADIDRGFFLKALEMMGDAHWGEYDRTPQGALLAVRAFALAYEELLEWAFVEYVGHLAKIAANPRVLIRWAVAEKSAFSFVERYVSGLYRHPFTGEFLIFGPEYVSRERAVDVYKWVHANAPWFSVSPKDWERIFFDELKSGPWKGRAIRVAKENLELQSRTAKPIPIRRHRVGRIDPVKTAFALLKKSRPTASIKALCELADASGRPPLKKWKAKTFLEAWRNPATRNAVKVFIAKISAAR